MFLDHFVNISDPSFKQSFWMRYNNKVQIRVLCIDHLCTFLCVYTLYIWAAMKASVLEHPWVHSTFESSHEIMALSVLRKLILQTCMCSHSIGLFVWFLVGPFVYFHTLCVRTVKALARLRRLTWAFAGRLCDRYHNSMSWLISYLYFVRN